MTDDSACCGGSGSVAETGAASLGPTTQVTILGSAQNDDHAVLLLGLNAAPDVYPYQVLYARESGQWVEAASSNSAGWTSTGAGDLGVETTWGPAPAGADVHVVELASGPVTVSVVEGYFFHAAWNVHAPT
jgi:hypothetical protein